jgi:hypothetical protein
MDNLEYRVKILEQELEILKSQIQATLLDIRENVLTNTHPALRAQSINPTTPANVNNHKPVQFQLPEQFENDDYANGNGAVESLPEQTPVRKVQANYIAAEIAQPIQIHEEEVAKSRHNSHEANWEAVRELEEWVAEKVEKIGTARTRALIQMYMEEGQVDADTEALLYRMVSLYEQDEQPTAQKKSAKRRPAPVDDEPQPQHRRKNSRRPAPDTRPPIVDEILNEELIERQSKFDHPGAMRMDLSEIDASVGGDSKERNVVLKLIAGIQTAGIGMKWRD